MRRSIARLIPWGYGVKTGLGLLPRTVPPATGVTMGDGANEPHDLRQQPCDGHDGDVRLILLVSGDSPRSERARSNLNRALAGLDTGRMATEEVDVLAHPMAVVAYGLIAVPALVVELPSGDRRLFYGELEDATSRACLSQLV